MSASKQRSESRPLPPAEGAGFRSILDDVRQRRASDTPPRVGTPKRGSIDDSAAQQQQQQQPMAKKPAATDDTNTNWKSSQRIRSPLLQRRTGLGVIGQSSSPPAAAAAAATPPPPPLATSAPRSQQETTSIVQQALSSTVKRKTGGDARKKRRTVARDVQQQGGDDDDNSGVPTSVDHVVFKEQEGSEDATSSQSTIPLQQQRRGGNNNNNTGAASAAAAFFSPSPALRGGVGAGGRGGVAAGTPTQRQRRADVASSVSLSTFMQTSTVAQNSDAEVAREKSRRAQAFQWGADGPREWDHAQQQQDSSSSPTSKLLPPFVPERVSSIFFSLKRELAGAEDSAEEQATSAAQALEQLAEATPVLRPVIDLALAKIHAERAMFRRQLAATRGRRDDSAVLRSQLEQQMSLHYSELLGERQRTKQAVAEAQAIRDHFSRVEEDCKLKVIDAGAEIRALQLDLRERTEEVAELREALSAVMSVRRAQQQLVEEVQERAEKATKDAEREVAIIREDLIDKNDKILGLNAAMEGERMLAKRELDEYKSIALPPVKSAALRAEADRYKREVAKLKEKVEKLVAELKKREQFEPAVAWEDFMTDADLQQLCTACGVPAKTSNSTMALIEADDLDEEDEEELNKLINRSGDFSQRLYSMWRSVLSTLDQYNREKEIFDRMAQVMLDVGLPIDLLEMHGEPLMVQALQQSHRRGGAADTRLMLDSPPIDAASPEPWIDPLYCGCYIQPPPQGTLPSALDAPIVAQAEYRFRVVKVLVPPCLVSLPAIRAVLVSALVLLGLNRVRDLNTDWHPARQFSFAVRAQLEAALSDIKAMAGPAGAALAAEQLAAQHGATGDAAIAAHDAAHAKRRRFTLPPLSEIDDKSTIAACMTVLYHRLVQYETDDAFIGLCLSMFLGKRPALLHARYFAVTLRSAGQFFARVEKMWRPSSVVGSLPKALFVNCIRPAFGICSSSANGASDIARLVIATFHTHAWTQVQAIHQSQVPKQQTQTQSEEEEAAAELERSKMSKAQQQQEVEAYNQTLLHTLTSWQDTSELSYKHVFGCLKGGDASPLLLQIAHLYAVDVVHAETAVRDGLLGYAKATLVARWNADSAAEGVEHWINNSGVGTALSLPTDSSQQQQQQQQQQNHHHQLDPSQSMAVAPEASVNLSATASLNYASLTAQAGSAAVHAAPTTLASALSRWQFNLGRGFIAEQEEQGVELVDDSQAGAAAAMMMSASGTLKNPDALVAADALGSARNSAAQQSLDRVKAFIVSAMFDPGDALRFEAVLSHLPTRPIVGFEDLLGHSPMEAPEPKPATAANAGPTPPVALSTLQAVSMSNAGHSAGTSELLRNLCQSLLHPRLLQQVASGSFFLVDPTVSTESITVAGCQELANEQATALSRAAAAPDIKKDKKKPVRK